MDWQALLWIGGLIVLFFVMMRGCGGMSGGCGMGSRRDTPAKSSDTSAGADDRANKHHAA